MESLYGEDQAGPTVTDQNAAGPEADKPQEDSKTFLINKDVCPGMKPGEEMVVRIVAEHEKEYEVEYAPETAKEEGAGNQGMAQPAGESAEAGEPLYG